MSFIDKKKLQLLRSLSKHAQQQNPSLVSYHQLHSIETINKSIAMVKTPFKNIAYIGPYPEYFLHSYPQIAELEKLFIIDYSIPQLTSARENISKILPSEKIEKYYLQAEHDLWPFQPNSIDLIIDNLTIHLATDINVSLKRILESLKPDGCLVGVAYGNSTLTELRTSFYLAEEERSGGVSPRTLKFMDMTTFGNIMNRTGYKQTTFYSTIYKECYDTPLHLIENLSNLCLSNVSKGRREIVSKDILFAMLAVYSTLFKIDLPENVIEDGEYKPNSEDIYEATFELVQYIGWKYDVSQPLAKQRGTATVSLGELLTELEEDPEVKKRIRTGEVGEEDDIYEDKRT